ncbi:hypothetical protein ACQP2E_16945 [Actinoplanes sp. CA-015351]|uniref:hypothetical protein n=1 Tax=Actinoplanes sp. CA-015351 TaxID=3239897 RepID=UPI003D98E7E8
MTDEIVTMVREHLRPGEDLRAAIWVSRAEDRTPMRLTWSELSPLRFRRRGRGPGFREDVQGAAHSLAVGLDAHIRLVTEPRVLALTGSRLMVLSRRSASLRPRWECPRTDLDAATEEKPGRLRLIFSDASSVTLLTPAAHIQEFLAG